jgi:hypothetical protein
MKQAKITNFCKWKAIVPQLFYTVDVSNLLPRKVAFYQLKQCHNPQGLCNELQSLPFSSLTPLTTKHRDRNLLTFKQIIDFYMFWNPLPSNYDKLAYNCHCFTLATSKLTIAIETEYRQVFYYLLCVKCAVLKAGATVCWLMARIVEFS